MKDVVISGIGMTKFGKLENQGLKSLGSEAILKALDDAGLPKEAIQSAFVGNAVAAITTGQSAIKGQVILNSLGIGGIPVFNIENACASSSSALNLAVTTIRAGLHDCVLVLGVEKMTHPDRTVMFNAFKGGIDVEKMKEELENANENHSIFMDIYAQKSRLFMEKSGVTKEHVAMVTAKNHSNGSLNPYAMRSIPLTTEDVLNDRLVTEPLTRYMCSPISDGAAAAIVCSAEYAKKLKTKPVYIASSVVLGGKEQQPGELSIVRQATLKAYEEASVTAADIDVFEVHDAVSPAELMAYEELGLCEPGDAGKLVEEKVTFIGGAKPVNTSGGLVAKGHPVGATGIGQVCELVVQLRGEAGARQVNNSKMGLAHNAGGFMGLENAVASITILKV